MKEKKNSYYKVKPCGIVKAAIQDVDTTGRIVTGFYNTYNFMDDDMDVLLSGAAKKSIKERGADSKAVAKIKHALNHDLTLLPGKIKVLEEKEVNGIEGIYFETAMADTTLGNDTLKNYLAGIYDNHSIGFRYIDIEMIERDNQHGNSSKWDKIIEKMINPEKAEEAGYMFAVKEIMLYEGSTVAFGCNQLTPYLGVKNGNKDALKIALFDRMDKLNKALKTGDQSDDMMGSFELQILQIKQMLNEMLDVIDLTPKEKKEAIKNSENPVENVKEANKESINLDYICNNINL